MELPIKVQEFIENQTKNKSLKQIKKSFEALSEKYKSERKDLVFIQNAEDVLSYALSRMPCSYSVNYAVASELKNLIGDDEATSFSFLDLGAGTMSATLAFDQIFNLNQITTVEKNLQMYDFEKDLVGFLQAENCINKNIELKFGDIISTSATADIVVASLSLNELVDKNLNQALDNMVNSAKQYIVIVEAGTKPRFDFMLNVRRYLINKGLALLAPCPHSQECQIVGGDWCHFACRVNRTKEQLYLKSGNSSYEDEKYTFLIFSKTMQGLTKSRVIARPLLRKGCVDLKLCTKEGIILETVTQKDKQRYKLARKLKHGNSFL